MMIRTVSEISMIDIDEKSLEFKTIFVDYYVGNTVHH